MGMKMIETVLMQPLAAIAAFVFVVLIALAFGLSMRTKHKEKSKRYEIRSLTPSQTARFTQEWESLQHRFVENPRWTVSEAEHLAREIMRQSGYPMADLESRAAAIEADYPKVVANYRQAQAIAQRDLREIDDLRQAVVQYCALFDKLFEVSTPSATGKLLAEENA
jgi:hypothetical protein